MSRLEEIKNRVDRSLNESLSMAMTEEDTKKLKCVIDYVSLDWLINRVEKLDIENEELKQSLQQILQVDEDTHIADAEKMKEIANGVLMQCSLI